MPRTSESARPASSRSRSAAALSRRVASASFHSACRRRRSSASAASDCSAPSTAARRNSSWLRSSVSRNCRCASARRPSAWRIASGSSRASASCSSRNRCSSSGVSARCSSCWTSARRAWNTVSVRPACCAARATSATACASCWARRSTSACCCAIAVARSLASKGSAPDCAPGARRPAGAASRGRSCARSLVRWSTPPATAASESAAVPMFRAAARVAARSSSRLRSRNANSTLLLSCGTGALSHASTRSRSVSPGNSPRRSASSSPWSRARSPAPLTSNDWRTGSATLPVRLTRQLTTSTRVTP